MALPCLMRSVFLLLLTLLLQLRLPVLIQFVVLSPEFSSAVRLRHTRWSLDEGGVEFQAPQNAIAPCTAAVVLLAGGVGRRMGNSGVAKQFMRLLGKPVLKYSLDAFARLKKEQLGGREGCDIEDVVVVVNEEHRTLVQNLAGHLPLYFANPGAERVESAWRGFQQLMRTSSADVILVHDAARPCISQHDVRRVLQDAAAHGAALLARPISGTVKRGSRGFVEATVDREALWEALTPQAFKRSILADGYRRWLQSKELHTDEASLAEAIGIKPKLTLASAPNVKITMPEDMALAAQCVALEEETEKHL